MNLPPLLSSSPHSAEVAASRARRVLQMQHGERPARRSRGRQLEGDVAPGAAAVGLAAVVVVVEAVFEVGLGAHVGPQQVPYVQRKIPESRINSDTWMAFYC